MNGYPKMERDRAIARTMEFLRAAYGNLSAAHHENKVFALGLELPAVRELEQAIASCSEKLAPRDVAP